MSLSNMLADLSIAELFCWHCQHRSVIGFIIMMDGRRLRQSRQKVGYETDWIDSASLDAVAYTRHTARLDTEEGRNFRSERL